MSTLFFIPETCSTEITNYRVLTVGFVLVRSGTISCVEPNVSWNTTFAVNSITTGLSVTGPIKIQVIKHSVSVHFISRKYQLESVGLKQ